MTLELSDKTTSLNIIKKNKICIMTLELSDKTTSLNSSHPISLRNNRLYSIGINVNLVDINLGLFNFGRSKFIYLF